ncbi:MAG TPA: ComEC/Rec2 family competence protein [Amoebophilaceae bacterium]|jgi:competence protein ComEC|nr:ComEC/Rec2 family competence protein [Amoebophilaceae bacterium]
MHGSWSGSLALLLLVGISYATVRLHVLQQQQESWSQWIAQSKLEGYCATVERVFPTTGNWMRCNACVNRIKIGPNWYASKERVRLFFAQKNTYMPQPGDRLLIRGIPKEKPLNDSKTNSRQTPVSYDTHHYSHFFRHETEFVLLPSNDAISLAKTLQTRCLTYLKKHVKDRSSVALVQAILFGDKDALPVGLRKAYADTGTVHVLAVSGLHVGMLYALLRFVLKRLFRLFQPNAMRLRKEEGIGRSYGPVLSILSEWVILVLLWGYTWLCQWAPPVLRATTMIGLARLGQMVHRPVDPYHTLSLAAFVALVWKPLWLFHCGFQLSYMATIGMLYVYPMLYRSISIQRRWLQKLWGTTALSSAAQISTLPLLLYYFKQFPSYFIVANWLVVPAVFGLLVVSLALLVVAGFPVLNQLFGFLLHCCVQCTHAWVEWIAQWPLATLSCTSVTGYSSGMLYVALLSVGWFVSYKQLVYPCLVAMCIGWHSIQQIRHTVTAAQTAKVVYQHDIWYQLHDRSTSISYLDALHHKLSSIQTFPGGTLSAWNGKMLVTIEEIPVAWYGWQGIKIPIDQLLIKEKLVRNIDVLNSIFAFETLVVYGDALQKNSYKAKRILARLDVHVVWIQPGATKEQVWATSPVPTKR